MNQLAIREAVRRLHLVLPSRYESLDSLHSDASCELSGLSGRSVYPRYTTCPALPDQLATSPSAVSLHQATRLPGRAGR